MPLSVFPKFRASSAVLSDKIDAVLRELAALLNGGLSLANVRPGAQFALANFAEPKGLYFLRLECTIASMGGNPVNNQSVGPAKTYVPIASRVLGWGYLSQAAGTYARLSGPGGLISQIDGTADGSGNYSGYANLVAPVALAAGDAISALANGSDLFSAVVALDADHQG